MSIQMNINITDEVLDQRANTNGISDTIDEFVNLTSIELRKRLIAHYKETYGYDPNV